MSPDKCHGCKLLCDPFDPEYCLWQGQRWHVTCAVKQVNDEIETLRDKQGRYDTTAANYSALQSKIDNMMDDREGLMKILHGVPEQAQELGRLFMRSGETLVRRDSSGHLLEGNRDACNLFQIKDRNKKLLEGS